MPTASPSPAAGVAGSHAGWPICPRAPFVDGAVIPLHGEAHRILISAQGPAGIRRVDGGIVISGPVETAACRLEAWLRERARAAAVARAAVLAAAIGTPAPPVTIRDPRTRWGSCSAAGRLSLSWRLVLAPRMVLDYVVAHEIAHLRERNHGPGFWALVARLCPETTPARGWLRAHGRSLHRFG